MSHKIIEDIKNNKREDWASLAKEKWTDTRIWLQEHGEWAFGIGILTGAIIVLAFEIVIALIVVAFLLGFGVWYFAGTNEADPAIAVNQPVDPVRSTEADLRQSDSKRSEGGFDSHASSESSGSFNGTNSSTDEEKDSVS